jgi:phage shock protein PspC (stress-responsive transcriptional regulator)
MTNATVTTPYKLMRARSGRMLGGVAAGLATASGLDVTVVRICIGATMLSGFGIPAYILMWIILPEESPKRGRLVVPAPENTARNIRIALVGLAVLSMLNKVSGLLTFGSPGRDFGLDGLAGLILLGIGASILFSRHRPDRNQWAPTPPPSSRSTAPVTPPGRADDGSYYFDDDEDDEPPTFAGPFGEVAQTVHGALSDAFSEVRTTLREARPARGAAPAAPAAPRRPAAGYDDYDAYDYDDEYYDDDVDIDATRPVATATVNGRLNDSGGAALGFARVVGWFALIWFALAGLACTLLWWFGGVSVAAPVVLALSSWLVLTAVSSTLSHAKFARAIIPSLALLLLPIGIAAATVRPVGDWGHQIHHPSSFDRETLSYRQSLGRMDLDFADTKFANETTTINARMGGGAIFVTVPHDVRVVLGARVSAGNYEIFGREGDGGISPRLTRTYDGCGESPKTLELNLRTGAGFIQVERENGKNKADCSA